MIGQGGPGLGHPTPRTPDLVSPFKEVFGGYGEPSGPHTHRSRGDGRMDPETHAYDAVAQSLASPFDEARPPFIEAPTESAEGAVAGYESPPYPSMLQAAAPAEHEQIRHLLLEIRDAVVRHETPRMEHQARPPQPPKVRTSFPADAYTELPQVLRAKVLASLETVVPTERVLWMVQHALATKGAEPGWADRLLIDIPDLPKAGPQTTVHVTVVETVPFDVNQVDKLEAFHRFCKKAFPSKAQPFHALAVGVYAMHRALEDQLLLPAGSIGQAAGVPAQLTADQAANYKLVVYALLPETVGMVIAPPGTMPARIQPRAALRPNSHDHLEGGQQRHQLEQSGMCLVHVADGGGPDARTVAGV